MATVVIDHAHDPGSGVYRIVVGQEVWQTTTDEEGEEHDVLVGHTHVEDFLFADDDERWSGTPEAVALAQRSIVQQALADRERVEVPQVKATPMPGVGEEL